MLKFNPIFFPVLCWTLLGGLCPAVSQAASSPVDLFSDPTIKQLIAAILKEDRDELQKLIESDVDLNATGDKGDTPLEVAMLSLKKTSFQILLEAGASPDAAVKSLPGGSQSLPALAAQGTDRFWLEQLAKHGANLNKRTARIGRTPIFFAIAHNRVENLRFLIERKVDLEIRDEHGNTPLTFAAQSDAFLMVLQLINAGADHTAKGYVNQTLVDHLTRTARNPGLDRKSPMWKARASVIELLERKNVQLSPEILASK